MSDDKAELFAYYWRMFAPDAPEPEREFHFDRSVKRNHRFDFAWENKLIAVEVDGGQFALHGGRHSTDADREKLNIAACLGWRVFRFSPAQLKKEPDTCIWMVVNTLEAK